MHRLSNVNTKLLLADCEQCGIRVRVLRQAYNGITRWVCAGPRRFKEQPSQVKTDRNATHKLSDFDDTRSSAFCGGCRKRVSVYRQARKYPGKDTFICSERQKAMSRDRRRKASEEAVEYRLRIASLEQQNKELRAEIEELTLRLEGS